MLAKRYAGRLPFATGRILSYSVTGLKCGSSRYASSRTDAISSDLPNPRLNYKDISQNVVYKSHNAFNRKAPLPVGTIQTIARLHEVVKDLNGVLSDKRHTRSTIGDRIRSNAKNPELKQAAMEEAKRLKAEIASLEERVAENEAELLKLAIMVPNDTHPSVPIGPESVSQELSKHGPIPLPASTMRDHVAIARQLDLIDFESAAMVTGTSWYYLRNECALLEMALTNYALSIAVKHGFTPTTTPDVVRADIAHRCGFQPRDPQSDQNYHVSYSHDPQSPHQHPDFVLSGTAEIPLAGMFANKIYNAKDLPMKVVGLGRAFRAEAGARGADTRGLYRVHQFTKLELFVVSEEGRSEEVMEELKSIQIEIFEGLGFPFRVLDMPTEELGASAYRKYDIEAWMPGRGSWGEISSTSNCTDYQARRLHIRYRRAPDANTPSDSQVPSIPFAHTLNGTAAAIPRLIVALLENGARFDESGNAVGLDLPKVLQPFWIGGNARNLIRWV